jgi:hypothetical protein
VSEFGFDPHSPEEKRDRQMVELLNELRVALPGVQILFAFLLAVPFTPGWEQVTNFQRDVFYGTLVATGLATACLIAPTAAHRLRFHQGDRTWLIESANVLAIIGLVALAIAIWGAFLLITDFLYDGARVWVFSIGFGAVLAGLWFVRPIVRGRTAGDGDS